MPRPNRHHLPVSVYDATRRSRKGEFSLKFANDRHRRVQTIVPANEGCTGKTGAELAFGPRGEKSGKQRCVSRLESRRLFTTGSSEGEGNGILLGFGDSAGRPHG